MEQTFSFAVVLAARLHDGNPWILERLAAFATVHAPVPRVVLVDFGSQGDHAAALRAVCEERGFTYVFVEDYGVFSLSLARNIGFRACEEEFVFFSDVDFVFESDVFSRLEKLIGQLGLRSRIDQIVNFPAYHLSPAVTQQWQGAADRDALLVSSAFDGFYEKRGRRLEFVAPYSNVFLISRAFFEMVGGYDSGFRGHGSEDFEFLTRAALHMRFHAVPRDLETDRFGPTNGTFYDRNRYTGFRRLAEAICQPAEALGLKAFHLWHPRQQDDAWRTSNDWRRTRLGEAFARYTRDVPRLLSVDFLPRQRTALCLCIDGSHDGYFYPLRLLGYSLRPIFENSEATAEEAAELIRAGAVDALAIFNPYMKSNARFHAIFQLARSRGVETIVIERGALPHTTYYAEDVSYAAESFSAAAFDKATFDKAELDEAAAYIAALRRGAEALEASDGYRATAERYADLAGDERPLVLIPLQLPEDLAVTRFLREAQFYDAFQASIGAVAAANPELRFIVKPHPLSIGDPVFEQPNVRLAVREDNVHTLIDLSSAVVCYNSGVGLLALLHEKPVVTVGNAFYNLGGVGHVANSLEEAIASLPVATPARADVLRLAAWFVCRKYSRFHADDDVRSFDTRKIHGYRNLQVTALVKDGRRIALGRMREAARFSRTSYGFSRLAPKEEKAPAKRKLGRVRKSVVSLYCKLTRPWQGSGIDEDPVKYLSNARNVVNRAFARLVIPRDPA